MKKGKRGKRLEGQEDHSLKAYKGIRRMLYYKELVPGQKISCRELAERMDMSLTPMIQALKFMEFQGFVRHEPNRGYFMTPFSLQEVEEIYELRELLEPSLIPITVKHLDQNGKDKLKSALEAHLSAVRESYLAERLFKNVEFHITLASLSNKPTQIRALRTIFDLLFLKYGGRQLSLTSMEAVDQEHQKVFDCVVSGDTKGAQKILLSHIANVKKQAVDIFTKIMAEREFPEI